MDGKREVELDDDWGPWNDYQVVDGVTRDAVVGICHKTSGELFTVADYERLPNYIIGEEFDVQEQKEMKILLNPEWGEQDYDPDVEGI